MTEERRRLLEHKNGTANWQKWGPYLSERSWGTVREDYSANGDAWSFLPHDWARSKAYRWGEDGLAGISDRDQIVCFALALWNGNDPFLKERLFGVTGPEGNHGEDVKEQYHYLDSTPTHSYMKFLYRYPHQRFPYEELVANSAQRGYNDPEFELVDTGIFEHGYFDVVVEYAKASPEDILIRISAINRGKDSAKLDLLPTLWCRNTWAWGNDDAKPQITLANGTGPDRTLAVDPHRQRVGQRWLYCADAPEVLFTDVETNTERLYGIPNPSPYVKDGIDRYVVQGEWKAVNPNPGGTKAALRYRKQIAPGESFTAKLRLAGAVTRYPFVEFDAIMALRAKEADTFYDTLAPKHLTEDERRIQRQAFAGLLWTKQAYLYDVQRWMQGDPAYPPPPPARMKGRNSGWQHFNAREVLSVPDKWEFPWFAAWDTAFHCIPLALVDPEFAKEQLLVLLRDSYLHPNGQVPAYEWSFSDVNPPVHAWAAWRVYQMDRKRSGVGDIQFLEKVFHKLLLNFTWWVNRKDREDNNIFQGGFMGLDNIGVFDQSQPLPVSGFLEQSDSTAWMAMYCLNMLTISLELALTNRAYEDMACKFFEHFLRIANAMYHVGEADLSLWDENDGWFYSLAHFENGESIPLQVRSIVGLIALFGVETLEPETLQRLPVFRRHMDSFMRNRPDLCCNVARLDAPGLGRRLLLSVISPEQLRRVLSRVLDEREFLSPHGIRSLSAEYRDRPYVLRLNGSEYRIGYEPGESLSGMFGGNSNWRGPVWFPINYLAIESLQKFFHYLGPDFKVEYPTGSGETLDLWNISADISRRLISLFTLDADGRRPAFGAHPQFTAAEWRDKLLFHEYFHGDSGAGLGASHQTGWSALVAKLLDQSDTHPTESLDSPPT